MSVFEVRGGPVTFRYLYKKYTKAELCSEYMQLLKEREYSHSSMDLREEAKRLTKRLSQPMSQLYGATVAEEMIYSTLCKVRDQSFPYTIGATRDIPPSHPEKAKV